MSHQMSSNKRKEATVTALEYYSNTQLTGQAPAGTGPACFFAQLCVASPSHGTEREAPAGDLALLNANEPNWAHSGW